MKLKTSKGMSEPTIPDLPEEILIEIFTRLSIRTIFTGRCVSKTWCNSLSSISSNPQFKKSHFTRSPVQFIIERYGLKKSFFHFVELEDDTDVDNSIKLFPCRFRPSWCDLIVVNSCNGFLCLITTIPPYLLNPVKVFNPITNEYINLPKNKTDDYIHGAVVSGFGFSAKTHQYKVVRLVHRRKHDRIVEVYTIGTKSWRTIGLAPKYPLQPICTTFFNGAIHWVCDDQLSSDFIISFDFESEKFGIVPPPLHFRAEPTIKKHDIRIGVLGEFLYLSHNMELWVMKQYGVQESWTQLCVVDGLPVASLQPIKYLSSGKILMHYNYDNLISYDPVENSFKEFKIPQFIWILKTIAHVPSFMSFNDAMMGEKGAKLRTKMCRV